MRAKIKCDSGLTLTGVRAILETNKWWPGFEQNSKQADDIKARMLATVAPKDFEKAEDGVKYVITDERTGSEGIIGYEIDEYVIRIRNDSSSVLQLDCGKFIHALGDYCDRNHIQIQFTDKIMILEPRNHNTVIEGDIVYGRKAHKNRARSVKKIEYTVARVGLVIVLILMALTFPWSATFPILPTIPVTPLNLWLFDILGKIEGSILVTGAISYLNYRYYYNSIKNRDIIWQIPGS